MCLFAGRLGPPRPRHHVLHPVPVPNRASPPFLGGETHPSGVWEPAVHRNETDTQTTDGVPVQVRFFLFFFVRIRVASS